MDQTDSASGASGPITTHRSVGHSAQDWNSHRPEIKDLYLAKDKTLLEVLHIMEIKHHFTATVNEYKKRFKLWGFKKNVRAEEMQSLLRIRDGRRNEGKDTKFRLRNQAVPQKKLDRFAKRQKVLGAGESSASARRSDLSPPPDISYDTPSEQHSPSSDTSSEKDISRQEQKCLRCLVLGIDCSLGDICIACRELVFTVQRQTLGFFGCVKTSLPDASIFEALLSVSVKPRVIPENAMHLDSSQIVLEFASQIKRDLAALVDDVVDWLNGSSLSNTCKVGIMSSPQFLNLVRPSVGENIVKTFQIMLYGISLAYTQPTATNKHALSIPELLQIGALAGHELLKMLDEKFKVESLRECSLPDIQTLFLLGFGTLLAVGYTLPASGEVITEIEPSSWRDDRQERILGMRSHLCQILAHYVLYFGSRMNLGLRQDTEEFFLLGASALWNRKGHFHWIAAEDREEGLGTEGGTEEIRAEEFITNAEGIPIEHCCIDRRFYVNRLQMVFEADHRISSTFQHMQHHLIRNFQESDAAIPETEVELKSPTQHPQSTLDDEVHDIQSYALGDFQSHPITYSTTHHSIDQHSDAPTRRDPALIAVEEYRHRLELQEARKGKAPLPVSVAEVGPASARPSSRCPSPSFESISTNP